MGSREWLVVGLKSRAASALVTKHFVTILTGFKNATLG